MLYSSVLLLLASLFASLTLANNKSIQTACECLSATLPGRVYYPDSKPYNRSIESYAYVGPRLRPNCVVAPESVEDVSAAVKELAKFPSVVFAIRSGGHNINKGFANTDHGVTIDLAALNDVSLDSEKETVSIGVGARWEKVYSTLEPHGLSVVGGRVGTVGTGGYITGGGIGYYSAREGYACDTVTNFDIVLANGSLIHANANSHTDLFHALKGGSNNFGIVVRFDQKTNTRSILTGGTIIYPGNLTDRVFATLSSYKSPNNFDPDAHLMFFSTYTVEAKMFAYAASYFHARPDRYEGSSLEAFAGITPQLSNNIQNNTPSFFSMQATYDPSNGPNTFMHWSNVHFRFSPEVANLVNAHFRARTLEIAPRYQGVNLSITTLFQSAPAAKLGNSLPFRPSDEPEKHLINYFMSFQHADPSIEKAVEEDLKKLTAEIEALLEAEGALSKFVYLNYASSWQKPLEGYGKEIVEEMKKVAEKYDPEHVFQKQVKGGFKLSKVRF